MSQLKIKRGPMADLTEEEQRAVDEMEKGIDTKPLLPRCGHCGDGENHGARIMTMSTSVGPLEMLVIYCANPRCLAIHNVQAMGIRQAPPSGLVVPGR